MTLAELRRDTALFPLCSASLDHEGPSPFTNQEPQRGGQRVFSNVPFRRSRFSPPALPGGYQLNP